MMKYNNNTFYLYANVFNCFALLNNDYKLNGVIGIGDPVSNINLLNPFRITSISREGNRMIHLTYITDAEDDMSPIYFYSTNGIIDGISYLQDEIWSWGVGGTPSSFQVTLSANPPAGGTVTGVGSYPDGSSVTITATPNPGYAFVNWTDSANVNTPSHTFTINNNMNFTANFLSPQLGVGMIEFGPDGFFTLFYSAHGNHTVQEIVVEGSSSEHGPFSEVWRFNTNLSVGEVNLSAQTHSNTGYQFYRFVIIYQGSTATTNVIQLPFM